MRYWISLVVIALMSCSVSFTSQDSVEISGKHSDEENLKLAEQIGVAVWEGQLRQHLQESIPELSGKNVDNMLGVRWGKTTVNSLTNDSLDTTGVYVKCVFQSSIPQSIARKAVDICIEYVNAEIEKSQSANRVPAAAISRSEIERLDVSSSSSVSESRDRAGVFPGLSVSQVLAVRELLVQREFQQLNLLLAQYQDDYLDNSALEYRLVDAYRSFQLSDSEYEQLFDDWMLETPDAYQPYLAAAQYYYRRGWSVRGGGFINKVAKADRKVFKARLRQSTELIRKSLAIDSNVMPAYLLLIDIEKSTGENRKTTPTASTAFKLYPDSIELRIAELKKYEPRWGGSLRKMQLFVFEAKRSQLGTSKVGILQGMIHSEISRLSYGESEYQESHESANKAVLSGEYDTFLFRRAKASRELGDYQSALIDVNKAIALRPASYENYLLRANIHVMMENAAIAAADYTLAKQLWPAAADKVNHSVEWAVNLQLNKALEVFQTDPVQAVADYDVALLLDNERHYTVFWRAMALARAGLDDRAIEGLKRSIELDPLHFESYRELDYLLLKERRWNEIISNWDSFLQLVPAHAEGFLERGGAHYQNGSVSEFRSDINRACELSSPKACQIAASF